MTYRIKEVKVLVERCLAVTFQNGTEIIYDIRKLYPLYPQFEELEENEDLFQQVKVDVGGYGISWNNELDLAAEEIWEAQDETWESHEIDVSDMVAVNLIHARSLVKMTQKQLSEATGIYQADISKIERGLANPSLSTLKRLADGLGMDLLIEFIKKD